MEKEQYLKSLFDKMTAIKKRSAEILEQAKLNGKLHYYFDPKKCKEGEIIKLENGLETIIKKYE